MLVFRMLCRITHSSDAHRTESVSVMDHKRAMGVNSRVLDQKQQNIFGRISLFWSVELQGHPKQLNGICDHDCKCDIIVLLLYTDCWWSKPGSGGRWQTDTRNSSSCKYRDVINNINVKSSAVAEMAVQCCTSHVYGSRAFSVAAPTLCLSADITNAASLTAFRNRLKTFLFHHTPSGCSTE